MAAEYFLSNAPPAQTRAAERALLRLEPTLSSSTTLARHVAEARAGAVFALPSDDSAGAAATTTLVACEEGAAAAVGGGVLLVSSARRAAFVASSTAAAAAGALAPASGETADAAIARLFPAAATDCGLEAVRVALLAAAQRHVTRSYHGGGAARGGSCSAAEGAKGCEVFFVAPNDSHGAGGFVLVTSVVVANPRSMWTGQMRARLRITVPSGEGGAPLCGAELAAACVSGCRASFDGSLQLRSHYHESGNAQMRQLRAIAALAVPVPAEATGAATTAGEAFAAAIVGALAALEVEVLAGLDDAYEVLGGQALKDMRRVLPVSGKRVNWAAGGGARMVRSALQAQQATKA